MTQRMLRCFAQVLHAFIERRRPRDPVTVALRRVTFVRSLPPSHRGDDGGAAKPAEQKIEGRLRRVLRSAQGTQYRGRRAGQRDQRRGRAIGRIRTGKEHKQKTKKKRTLLAPSLYLAHGAGHRCWPELGFSCETDPRFQEGSLSSGVSSSASFSPAPTTDWREESGL